MYSKYKDAVGGTLGWVLASALLFGTAHIFLGNFVAPVMSFFGGILFASTYARTRSLALVAIEHALYGDMIFTVGLGQYFYHGAAH
jgi:membrane protease YdiL (CAAX protease family)